MVIQGVGDLADNAVAVALEQIGILDAIMGQNIEITALHDRREMTPEEVATLLTISRKHMEVTRAAVARLGLSLCAFNSANLKEHCRPFAGG